MTASPFRVALIAGELSGDLLGAGLIAALRKRIPGVHCYGVAGPRMAEAGCEAIETIDQLSVMGLAEVLPAIPRLLRLRSRLVRRFERERPDLVIGIDAPDFNLGLERRLRRRGLTTVHVVSPTVWAWRPGRVHTIARSVDRMLCLFPFEPPFYTGAGVAADYIGHPLADELDDRVKPAEGRQALGLDVERPCVAILPGSRHSELGRLAAPFAEAARRIAERRPDVQFVTPVAKPSLRSALDAAIAEQAPGLAWTVLDGRSREAMRAADVVLLASGTATLESLLLGRPMVVAYKTSALTAWLMVRAGLLKVALVSLPNLLAAEPTVPERLQDAATPEQLAADVLALLGDPALARRQLRPFDAVRRELRRNAAERAAEVVAGMLESARRAR